ncbi:hypothetical protein Scani_34780 [Streptomyces caniferus]|uniref:Uncharacterized protein n=1 Tax=Streptomyces caniferus TaxID=285557 RepID=A0A640S7P6_9ACTN|nr:hypothetical protein [Streptomyces caniferus]GFE07210.1 hypothetical protein Scani_34780 [Streptomyces caniferus]
MHYATTKSTTTELHRQDAGKVDGYCGKFAPNPVDPEAASRGLAARTLRTCRKCDEIAEDRRRAELSLADGLFVTEVAASSVPAATEESLFGAEELADLYVAPKCRRQPRPSAPAEDGGLFGDAELAAAQSGAERADVGDAPALPTGADTRDRTADAEALADVEAEAESRARVQAQMDREDAQTIVPTLGWSDQIHAGMRAAAAGRLVLGADGEPRIVGANGGGRGHKTRADRLLMLVRAGMLNRARRGHPLTPTADGARALHLANLYPDDVHATDREAYAARLRAARRPGVTGEEAKSAARMLPPLPHGVEAERRVKARFADMRRSVERVAEIRRSIDERAEQARRQEAERKRARSASKAPADEGGRLRHVFCGPDPRIVARWEAERAEAPRPRTRRDSSADPEPALDASGQRLDRVPAGAQPHPGAAHDALAVVHGDRLLLHADALLQRSLRQIGSSAKPHPGCTNPRSIGHPRTETSATRARPSHEVDHGLRGRGPMADEERTGGGRVRVASALAGPLHGRWPMCRRWPCAMADAGRPVTAARCAAPGGVADALRRCADRSRRAANTPYSPAGIRGGVSNRVSAARHGAWGIRDADATTPRPQRQVVR